MKETEEIRVYLRIEDGRTQCVCPRDKKRCKRNCQPDVVIRDRFRGWEQLLGRDRYGKCELDYRKR